MRTVPAPAGVYVQAVFRVTHPCPFADEIDHGDIEIAWWTGTHTIELHSLADWLRRHTEPLSHESVTHDVAQRLRCLDGIELVRVRSTWDTAGATVTVTASHDDALLREPVDAAGA